jgi:pteridine reductase
VAEAEPESLAGKTALVTGAARRIGAAIARALHGSGCNVAIHYRDSAADAGHLVDSLNAIRENSACALQCNLLHAGAPSKLVESVVDWSGKLDVLVNNASSFYPTPIDTLTEAQWDDLLGSNLKAPLFLAQAARPHLRTTHGSIVNMIDVHARRPLRHHLVYGSAKAGLAMLTRSLAKDLAPEIRVNGISPGAILWPEDDMSDEVKSGII